jgi:hypothetical protein
MEARHIKQQLGDSGCRLIETIAPYVEVPKKPDAEEIQGMAVGLDQLSESTLINTLTKLDGLVPLDLAINVLTEYRERPERTDYILDHSLESVSSRRAAEIFRDEDLDFEQIKKRTEVRDAFGQMNGGSEVEPRHFLELYVYLLGLLANEGGSIDDLKGLDPAIDQAIRRYDDDDGFPF